MKTINSLSGGKTLSYIAVNYPADYNVFALVRTDDKDCLFPDKKIRQLVSDRIGTEFIGTLEMDEIIYTMFDLEQYIGKKIHWISPYTFEDIIDKAGGYLPNKMRRFCTSEMKTRPIAEWKYNNISDDIYIRFGYRANEKSRAKRMLEGLNDEGFTEVKIIVGKTKNGKQNKWETINYCKPEFPLIEDNIYKDEIEEFWKDKPVRFAYMNNCVGCWWRSPLLLSHMNTKEPNKMNWFVEQEEKRKGTFRSDVKYKDIVSWKKQIRLFDDDFNECDSGYCGL